MAYVAPVLPPVRPGLAGSTMTYFIDESGGAGSLTPGLKTRPIFAVACVGLGADADLAGEILDLKTRHNIAASHLKVGQVHRRAAFLGEVFALLAQRGCPVMVEVIEKRFVMAKGLVAAHLIDADDPLDEGVARGLVEFVAHLIPDEVLVGRVEATGAPRAGRSAQSLAQLRDWARGREAACVWSALIVDRADRALAALPGKLATRPADPWGAQALPWLNGVNSIRARLAVLHAQRLEAVTLVRDQARRRDAGSTSRALAAPRCDFRRSYDEIGLQLAGLVANTMTRHMRTVLAGAPPPWPLWNAVQEILAFQDRCDLLGARFLATDQLLDRAQVRARTLDPRAAWAAVS